MNISAPFIRRPVATVLLSVGLFISGVVAYLNLPVAHLPDVDIPTIMVATNQQGADPETMAATVAAPLERRIGQISGVTELTSRSQQGSSSVTVQFDISRNIEDAARDVQAAINGAQADLPGNLSQRPTIRKFNPSGAPVLILAITSPIRSLTEIYEIADLTVATRISQVDGVGEVQVGGGQQPAMRVTVDPVALKARNISMEEVRNAISEANALLPLGRLEGKDKAFTITTGGQLEDPEDYASIILSSHGGGVIVRLGDVARIERSTADRLNAGWYNDDPAIILIVQKSPGGNVVETVDRIYAAMPEILKVIPADMSVSVLSDHTVAIRKSIEDLELTLAASIALVTLVVFLFLRRLVPTAAAMIAVPLSLAGTVTTMWFAGFSLDNVSLLALTISVGFVVDDAIVVIENCYRNMQAGLKPAQAALAGSRQIGFTIVSISLSLVAAFIPLLFMGGVMGKILQEFGWTLAFAILISAVISLTLTPMICGRFMHRLPRPRETWLDRRTEPFFDAMNSFYLRTLDFALGHRWVMVVSIFAVLGLSVATFTQLPIGLIPRGDGTLVFGFTRAAPDISFDGIAALQRQVTAIALKDSDVVSVAASVGGGQWGSNNQGRFYMSLKPEKERKASSQQVIDRLREAMKEIKGAEVTMFSASGMDGGGRGSRSEYQVTLWSTELDVLAEWEPRVVEAMKGVDGVADVNSDREPGGPEARLTIDRMNAARLGVSMQAVSNALNNAFSQRQISTLYGYRNQYRIILEVSPDLQRDMDALSRIYVAGSGGNQIALSAIAEIEMSSAPLQVNHQNQFPSITFSFNLKEGVTLDEGLTRILATLEHLHMPDSVIIDLAGDTKTLKEQRSGQLILIFAALLTVYIVLGILYESLIHPLTILSTLPSAGLGALLTLHLTGHEFSLVALIGIILLIGIVKKNGIMLVDFALEAERKQGLSGEEAIRQACRDRFRPILMTSLAAMLGALPLILSSGPGSELRQPLGLTIIGGLALSQLLTIYTTPVIYLLLDKLRRKGREQSRSTLKPAVGSERH